jgi:hypothetical protein
MPLQAIIGQESRIYHSLESLLLLFCSLKKLSRNCVCPSTQKYARRKIMRKSRKDGAEKQSRTSTTLLKTILMLSYLNTIIYILRGWWDITLARLYPISSLATRLTTMLKWCLFTSWHPTSLLLAIWRTLWLVGSSRFSMTFPIYLLQWLGFLLRQTTRCALPYLSFWLLRYSSTHDW